MPSPRELTDRGQTPYSVEFFDLQLCLAEKVAELTGKTIGETVGDFTNIYVRLSMGPRLDPGNPEWKTYLSTLATTPERAAWTHKIHLERLHLRSGPNLVKTVGCFSYELLATDRARLHFHAAGSESPLSTENRAERLRDLAGLFAHLRTESKDGMKVVGASWLYNLDRYRRLFPTRYLASLRMIEHPYQRMPLWGQFLNRDLSVRPEASKRFLADIEGIPCFGALPRCFPFSVLHTAAPVEWFYEHLGL